MSFGEPFYYNAKDGQQRQGKETQVNAKKIFKICMSKCSCDDRTVCLYSCRHFFISFLEAVKKAGYEPGKDFKIAMDAASSEWKSEKGKGYYKLPKAATEYTAEELIGHWAKLCEKYPIISIEDGLFVTNTERLAKGVELGASAVYQM